MAFLWTVHIVRPRINSWRFRMAVKVKNFYDALPNRLALKRLTHGDTLNVSGICAV